MTKPTPHGQVPEALIDLIDTYAETRHRCGGIYNARTEAARKAVIEALSGVQALSAGPMVTSEQRRLIGVIAEKIEDGTLFQSGIYQKKDLARFVRNMLDVTPTAPAASPTPPAEQKACDTQLFKFYGVSTTAELIAAQARHIEKLQAKIPPTPSFAPQRVREG